MPCEKGAALWDNWIMYGLVAAAHANLGEMDRAAHWKRRMLEANPRASIARVRNIRASDNADYLAQIEHSYRGMRAAGVPEN